jgi:hypothetical protein
MKRPHPYGAVNPLHSLWLLIPDRRQTEETFSNLSEAESKSVERKSKCGQAKSMSFSFLEKVFSAG